MHFGDFILFFKMILVERDRRLHVQYFLFTSNLHIMAVVAVKSIQYSILIFKRQQTFLNSI